MNSIVLKDKNNKFLKLWKAIKYELFFEDIDRVINNDINEQVLPIDEINNYDYSGNIILFYIINEMSKLLDMNQDKFIKTNIVYLLMDIINKVYDEFDLNKNLTNPQIKRFNYILNKSDNRLEESIEDDEITVNIKDDDEGVDVKQERNIDDKEENEALDIDGEMDYEVDFEE